jgi:hypothetical protein
MKFRNIPMALIGVAAAAMMVPAMAAPEPPPVGGDNVYRSSRKGKGRNNGRGKGLRAKPKKHPNLLTVSKRVRRKHRRAS